MNVSSAVLPTTYGGQRCPACNGPEFTLRQLQLARLLPEHTFDCPVCGCKLRYTYVYRFPTNELFLHVVSDVLTADGSIRL